MVVTLRPRPIRAGIRQDNRRAPRATPVPEPQGTRWSTSDREVGPYIEHQYAQHTEAQDIVDAKGSRPVSSPKRSASPVMVDIQRSVSPSVKIKLEPSPSPEIESIKEKQAEKPVKVKRQKTTPPMPSFSRTSTLRPRTPTHVAVGRTRRRRSPPPTTPVPESRPKIYMHLRRENVHSPWKFVPKP